jgi:hypothetical protein
LDFSLFLTKAYKVVLIPKTQTEPNDPKEHHYRQFHSIQRRRKNNKNALDFDLSCCNKPMLCWAAVSNMDIVNAFDV